MAESKRGLASADKKTRERVARAGGKASRGGGRRQSSND
jgi:hypothetical protein